jgi:thiol-disulfide isomerase/thioredoxin
MSKRQTKLNNLPKLHTFFLNPYPNARFSTCPMFSGKTRLRKKPFVVHIDPDQLLILNMTGPFCPKCDLMILHQDKLEALMIAIFEPRRPELIGREYLVMGTVDRQTWLKSQKEPMPSAHILERLHIFKKVVTFEARPWQ